MGTQIGAGHVTGLAIFIALLALAVSVYFGVRNTELRARVALIETSRRVDEPRPTFDFVLQGVDNVPLLTLNGPEDVTALRMDVVKHELHPGYFRKVWFDSGVVARMRPGESRALQYEVDGSARGGVLRLRLSGATRAGRFDNIVVEALCTYGESSQ